MQVHILAGEWFSGGSRGQPLNTTLNSTTKQNRHSHILLKMDRALWVRYLARYYQFCYSWWWVPTLIKSGMCSKRRKMLTFYLHRMTCSILIMTNLPRSKVLTLQWHFQLMTTIQSLFSIQSTENWCSITTIGEFRRTERTVRAEKGSIPLILAQKKSWDSSMTMRKPFFNLYAKVTEISFN